MQKEFVKQAKKRVAAESHEDRKKELKRWLLEYIAYRKHKKKQKKKGEKTDGDDDDDGKSMRPLKRITFVMKMRSHKNGWLRLNP